MPWTWLYFFNNHREKLTKFKGRSLVLGIKCLHMQFQKHSELGFEYFLKILLKYLNISLTAMATLHAGKIIKYFPYTGTTCIHVVSQL